MVSSIFRDISNQLCHLSMFWHPNRQVSKAVAGRVLPSHHSSCSFWSIQREPTQQARDFNTPWVPKWDMTVISDRKTSCCNSNKKTESKARSKWQHLFFGCPWRSFLVFEFLNVSELLQTTKSFSTQIWKDLKHKEMFEAKIHAKKMRSILHHLVRAVAWKMLQRGKSTVEVWRKWRC